MRGKILDYTLQNSQGIISGDNGQRYTFSNADWKGDNVPKKGQIVDFEVEDTKAKAIYLESSTLPFDSEQLKSVLINLKESSIIKKTVESGMQNKLGFILSLMMIGGLFLPILEVPFVGNVNLLDGGMGKTLVILLLGLAYLFYIGGKHIITKSVTGAIAVIIFFQFYDLFSGLDQTNDFIDMFGGRQDVNLFKLLKFGTFVMIPLSLILLYAGLRKKYNENF